MQCGEEGQLQQRDWRKTQCGTHLGLLGDLAGKAAGALKHQSGCLFSPAFISMLSGSSWLTLTSEQQRPKGKARRGKKKTFSVWSTAGDISTAATASTPSHSFRSSTRRLVSGKMLLLLLCDAGSRHWADGVTEFQQVLCMKTPPPPRQRCVFRRVSPVSKCLPN